MLVNEIRYKVKNRFIVLCKEMYPEQAKHFTRFKQVQDFLNLEIAAGRGENPYAIIYERWPHLFENQMEQSMCEENNFVLRDWIKKDGKYKGCVAKMVSYVLGEIRKTFPAIQRRQAATIGEDGRKIRRRNKHQARFNPDVHIKNSPKKVVNNNGKREM